MSEQTETPAETLPETGDEKKKEWVYKGDNWYENLDVSVEQVDRFIKIGMAVLILVFILIGLEAAGIFKL